MKVRLVTKKYLLKIIILISIYFGTEFNVKQSL